LHTNPALDDVTFPNELEVGVAVLEPLESPNGHLLDQLEVGTQLLRAGANGRPVVVAGGNQLKWGEEYFLHILSNKHL
jgi:hypothetical protein